MQERPQHSTFYTQPLYFAVEAINVLYNSNTLWLISYFLQVASTIPWAWTHVMQLLYVSPEATKRTLMYVWVVPDMAGAANELWWHRLWGPGCPAASPPTHRWALCWLSSSALLCLQKSSPGFATKDTQCVGGVKHRRWLRNQLPIKVQPPPHPPSHPIFVSQLHTWKHDVLGSAKGLDNDRGVVKAAPCSRALKESQEWPTWLITHKHTHAHTSCFFMAWWNRYFPTRQVMTCIKVTSKRRKTTVRTIVLIVFGARIVRHSVLSASVSLILFQQSGFVLFFFHHLASWN